MDSLIVGIWVGILVLMIMIGRLTLKIVDVQIELDRIKTTLYNMDEDIEQIGRRMRDDK